MGFVVLVQPDPFATLSAKVADYIPNANDTPDQRQAKERSFQSTGAGALSQITQVSRPLAGISVKPNTAAFAQVIGADGKPRVLLNELASPMDSEGRIVPREGEKTVWTDWFLQTVREERTEKTQLIETFGDTYLYAFGKRPQSLIFQGTLLNTADFNWRAVFWENWDREFRATKLIEHRARMFITWDDVLVEGYPINAVTHQVADTPSAMVFSFTFFVTNYISLAARNGFAAERLQTTLLAPIRDRLPQQDDQIVGTSFTQDFMRRSGLRGINEISAKQFQGHPLAEMAANAAGGLAINLAYSGSAEQAQNILAAETARFARQMARYAVGTQAAGHGMTSGEANKWFGYLASSANQLAHQVGVVTGQPTGSVPTTIDDVIQEMGYAIEEGIHAKPHAIAAERPVSLGSPAERVSSGPTTAPPAKHAWSLPVYAT